MINKYSSLAAFVLLINLFTVSAQIFPEKNYPKDYFAWPVQAKIGLAANFGELRPNHYHMGLDCKTDQKENAPILAAADGYIAKVKIEPSGFGRCLYINHPNGLTTLYAHLNDFFPALEKYVKEQQYTLKSWAVFIDIPKNLFPVKQGEFIAFSGNTGGSQGPHLHFEIRDTKTDKVLNPLLFGFPITDNIPPDILRLAVYDRNVSTYEQTPRFYSLKKQNGKYVTVPSTIVVNSDKVSFAITAYDRYTGSTNKNGIYEAVIYDNQQAVAGFQLDSISYDETRYLNAHIDYRLRDNGGPFVQHVSRMPGYIQGVYKEISGDGTIKLADDEEHEIKIEVRDANENVSVAEFNLKKETNPGMVLSDTKNKFIPGCINVFENSSVKFYLPENNIYDFFNFKFSETVSSKGTPVYQIHYGYVPVHLKFTTAIKNTVTPYPDKMVMHRYWKNKDDYAKAVPSTSRFEKNWYKAAFRAFGNYELITDTIPPVVTPIGFRNGMDCSKSGRIAFIVTDNSEDLYNFTAELDGNWLRFTNDKGRTFIYKFDEYCPPGEHILKISVEDCVGNKTERTYNFTR